MNAAAHIRGTIVFQKLAKYAGSIVNICYAGMLHSCARSRTRGGNAARSSSPKSAWRSRSAAQYARSRNGQQTDGFLAVDGCGLTICRQNEMLQRRSANGRKNPLPAYPESWESRHSFGFCSSRRSPQKPLYFKELSLF
jgi:hypothetical protein